MNPGTIALAALGAGVAGWALENALFAPPPRHSALVPDLPFLPVYAEVRCRAVISERWVSR